MTAEIIPFNSTKKITENIIATAPNTCRGPSFQAFAEALSDLTPERLPEFIASLRRSAGLPPLDDKPPPRKKRGPPSDESIQKARATRAAIHAAKLPIKERVQLLGIQMNIHKGNLRTAMRATRFDLELFCEWYPMVNIEWLLTGEGPMYRGWE